MRKKNRLEDNEVVFPKSTVEVVSKRPLCAGPHHPAGRENGKAQARTENMHVRQ